MKRYSHYIFLFALFIFVRMAFADEQPQLTQQLGGTIQTWMSASQYGADTTNMAIGLRRVRIRYYAQYDKAKFYIQSDIISGLLLDARIEYHFNNNFNIRAGRFIGAGVRGGGLTSHTKLDIIERPFMVRSWGSGTVGSDYRDFGIQAEGKVADFTGRLWLHNGDGKNNITNRVGDFYRGKSQNNTLATAVDAMLIYKPAAVKGLEVGGHYGVGNKNIKDYSSYSAYAYFKPGRFSFKAELISLTDKEANKTMRGYYLFGGYKITNTIEVLGRFENYDPNIDIGSDDINIITIGAALYEFEDTKNHRIAAAFVMPTETGTDLEDLNFKLMWQFLFKTK
jgi:hypothetical protein